jgi:hypothetical protein
VRLEPLGQTQRPWWRTPLLQDATTVTAFGQTRLVVLCSDGYIAPLLEQAHT